jgi:6-phosphogluconolactonase
VRIWDLNRRRSAVFYWRMTCTSLVGLPVGVLLAWLPLAARSNAQARPPSSTPATPDGRLDRVYFGTYTDGKSRGVYSSRLDPTTGALTTPELAATTVNPSYLALHPNHRFLYAVNEVSRFDGKSAGAVSAFAIDRRSGRLRFLDQRTSGGPGPCHLVVDPRGKAVLVANYNGGSVEVLPIQSDGRLGEPSAFIQHTGSSINPQRQEGPHAHCVAVDGTDRLAFVCDLGLDKVMIYRFNAARGTLTPSDPPWARIAPGSGPRHIAFAPGDHFAYVISEMASTVTAFSWSRTRRSLTAIQTVSTLDGPVPGNSGAEIVVAPGGRFLYVSNRGDNSLVVFAIAPRTGRLTRVQRVSSQGRTPRGFGIDPSGRWLLAANQDSDSVVVFRIDPTTGSLTATGQTVEIGKPVSVVVLAN